MVSLPSNLPSKSTIHVGKDPTRWALPAISSIITPLIGVKEPPVTDIFSAIYRSCNSMYNDRRCPPCMGKAISEVFLQATPSNLGLMFPSQVCARLMLPSDIGERYVRRLRKPSTDDLQRQMLHKKMLGFAWDSQLAVFVEVYHPKLGCLQVLPSLKRTVHIWKRWHPKVQVYSLATLIFQWWAVSFREGMRHPMLVLFAIGSRYEGDIHLGICLE